jgi:hypothetical protein
MAINTVYYFIINALYMFSHDIFNPNLYVYLCQKIHLFQLNVESLFKGSRILSSVQHSAQKNPGLNLRNGVFVALNHGFLPMRVTGCELRVAGYAQRAESEKRRVGEIRAGTGKGGNGIKLNRGKAEGEKGRNGEGMNRNSETARGRSLRTRIQY